MTAYYIIFYQQTNLTLPHGPDTGSVAASISISEASRLEVRERCLDPGALVRVWCWYAAIRAHHDAARAGQHEVQAKTTPLTHRTLQVLAYFVKTHDLVKVKDLPFKESYLVGRENGQTMGPSFKSTP